MADSEEEEEVKKPKTPPREPDGLHFFISNINSYSGRTLLQELRNDKEVREPHAKHIFRGTINPDEGGGLSETGEPPEGVSEVIDMEKTKDFRHIILNSNVTVYDLRTSSYEEVDYAIKTLKTSDLE